MSLKPNQDAKNIGARFRSARSLVPDLNRKSFCERHGINRYTMQSWENGLHVSKGKNVEKFIEALAREGVYCTSEWLIDGKGEPAKPLILANQPPKLHMVENTLPSDKSVSVINHLQEAYAALNQELIAHRIEDDTMAPKFLSGDMVFGLSIGDDKSRAHQKYCIIELNPGRMIVRKILVAKDSLLLMALDERIPTFTLNLDSEVFAIAWHLIDQSM